MCELGIQFGQGLQLVNVLRDIAWDLRRGRCYLPVQQPRALLDPGKYDSIRAEYMKWLDIAGGHLDAGWQYTAWCGSKVWVCAIDETWDLTSCALQGSHENKPRHP